MKQESIISPEPQRVLIPLVAGVTALVPSTLLVMGYFLCWALSKIGDQVASGDWLRGMTLIVCGILCPMIIISSGATLIKSVNYHRVGICLICCGFALMLFCLGLRPI